MRLNEGKWKVLFILSEEDVSELKVTINGHALDVVGSYNYLDVDINTKLD